MAREDITKPPHSTQHEGDVDRESFEKQRASDNESTPTEMDVAVFQAVTDHYKQDLREFFVRNNLFVAVHAALLSTEFIKGIPKTFSEYVITTVIFLGGLSFAYLWKRVADAGVFWVSKWRDEVQFLSRKYSRYHSYEWIEQFAKDNPKMCSEVIAKDLPRFIIVFWSLLWLVITITFIWSLS